MRLRTIVTALAGFAVLLGAVGGPAPAGAFSLIRDTGIGPDWIAQAEAARWSAEDYLGTGLHDGIQVGVEPGFALALGAAPGEVAETRAAVVAAFRAWENPALRFDITFDADLSSGAYEILLQTYDGPTGFDQRFGQASWATTYVQNRLLTNGTRLDGWLITGATIDINAPNVQYFRSLFAHLTDQQLADALQRLIMHEAGHTIGLGHPTVDPRNYDTDTDPYNPMVIDPLYPGRDLIESTNTDADAIMSGLAYGSSFEALFETALHYDDAGGRDFLYPAVPEPDALLLLAAGALAVAWRGRCRFA